MLSRDGRHCDVCGEGIPRNVPYRVGRITADAAAMLLDTDDPDLVPTWTQLLDGTVQLDFCLWCYSSMSDPYCAVEGR